MCDASFVNIHTYTVHRPTQVSGRTLLYTPSNFLPWPPAPCPVYTSISDGAAHQPNRPPPRTRAVQCTSNQTSSARAVQRTNRTGAPPPEQCTYRTAFARAVQRIPLADHLTPLPPHLFNDQSSAVPSCRGPRALMGEWRLAFGVHRVRTVSRAHSSKLIRASDKRVTVRDRQGQRGRLL